MPDAATKLKRRVDAFLASGSGGRDEVAAFAGALGALGRVVIIGGMLRDLSLAGPRGFRSDVDFVVHPASLAEYDRFVGSLGGKPNRFGGHSVRLGRWTVEAWPLQRTWAAANGHARLRCVEDLLGVTFFDWDAVLYDVAGGRVIAGEGYFERLAARVLDLNFEPNPNPLGNAVRTLRYMHRWDAALGLRLRAHLAGELSRTGWDGLVAYERRSFAEPRLGGEGAREALLARIASCAAPRGLARGAAPSGEASPA